MEIEAQVLKKVFSGKKKIQWGNMKVGGDNPGGYYYVEHRTKLEKTRPKSQRDRDS